jgi:hypothetical protein
LLNEAVDCRRSMVGLKVEFGGFQCQYQHTMTIEEILSRLKNCSNYARNSASRKSNGAVRNMVHVVLYGADKAVIVYIVHDELYRIIILNNNYNYHSIDITASALYS